MVSDKRLYYWYPNCPLPVRLTCLPPPTVYDGDYTKRTMEGSS